MRASRGWQVTVCPCLLLARSVLSCHTSKLPGKMIKFQRLWGMGITLKDNDKRPLSPGDFLASFGPTMEGPGKGKILALDFGAGEGSCKEVSGLRLGGKEREVGGGKVGQLPCHSRGAFIGR